MSTMAHLWIQTERRDLSNVLLAMAGRALASGASPLELPFELRGLDDFRKLTGSATVNAAVSGGTLDDAADALVSAERAVVIANSSSFDSALAERDATLAVALSVVASSGGRVTPVLFARTRANGQGLSDLGLARESMRLARGVASGSIRAALIVGEDPVSGASDPERVRESLAGLEFLVVADTVPTETTELAHVVMPLAAPGESSGSFTSSERRVRTVAGPLASPAGFTDLEMVSALASGFGVELGPDDVPTVRGELAAELGLPGFPAGTLPPDGVRWGGDSLYEAGLRTPDGALDLTVPMVDAPEFRIDARWTDSVEIRFSKLAEEVGLKPRVVRRHRVSA